MRHLILSVWGVILCFGATPAAAADKDPHEGHFTLEEATAGLEGKGPLMAALDTSKGRLDCRLFEKESPITVANFVGLARGLRSFLNPRTHQWEKRPYYDGLPFHRVIPGFMVQTGDFSGKGSGEAGYRIPNEHSPRLRFNRPGLLGMANYGPDTNSAQFFITEAAAKHLNGAYTIFGECTPTKVVREIAKGPRDMNDRPRTPVTLTKVTISRTAPRKHR